MLAHFRSRLFCQVGVASLALQPLILALRFDASVAAHGLLSTIVASILSFAVTLVLLWAIVAKRSALAGLVWIIIAVVAVYETIHDTMNGWLLQPQHVLGGVSLLLDAVCACLLVEAFLAWRKRGPMPKTPGK